MAINDRLRSGWVFLKLLFTNYASDGCQSTAAALTYQTLFAVVPLLTVAFWVLDSFQAFVGVGDTLQSFLFDNIVPENVSVVQEYLASFADQTKNLGVVSIVFIVVTAFLMLFTIERTFNQIWQIKEPRQGFQRVLVYWAILTLVPFLLGGGLFITTYVISLPLISDVANSSTFLLLLPPLLSAFMFSMMYITIPNCVVPLRHGLFGGILVAILFELAKQFFASVMARSDFEVIYGTFAAVPLFLIWIYLSWTIILIGAELVKVLGLYQSHVSGKIESPFVQMLIVLEIFFRSHQKGSVVTEENIAAHGHRINMEAWRDYKRRLLSLGIIRVVEKGGMVLSHDLNEITVWQLYRQFPWQLPEGIAEGGANWETTLAKSLSEIYHFGQASLHVNLESLFRAQSSETAL